MRCSEKMIYRYSPIAIYRAKNDDYRYLLSFDSKEDYDNYMDRLVLEYKSNNQIIKELDTVEKIVYEERYTTEYKQKILDRAESLFNSRDRGRKKASVFVKKVSKLIDSRKKRHKKKVDSYNKKLDEQKRKIKKNLEDENKLFKRVAEKLVKINKEKGWWNVKQDSSLE